MARLSNVGNKIIFFNIDHKYLTGSVNDNHSISICVSGSHKAQLIGDFLLIKKGSTGYFVHIEVAEFGNDEYDTIFWSILHENREVTSLLHLDFSLSFYFLGAWSGVADFHHMKFLTLFSGLLLTKAEETVFITCVLGDGHFGKCGCKPFNYLLLLLFGEIELHMTANLIVCALVDPNEVTPFLWLVSSVIHDLSIRKLGILFKDFLGRIAVSDLGMIHIGLANNTKCVFIDPSPETNSFSNMSLLELSFGVQIESLYL